MDPNNLNTKPSAQALRQPESPNRNTNRAGKRKGYSELLASVSRPSASGQSIGVPLKGIIGVKGCCEAFGPILGFWPLRSGVSTRTLAQGRHRFRPRP